MSYHLSFPSIDFDRYYDPPEDTYELWFEKAVTEGYSEEFAENLGAFEDSNQEHDWLFKLYEKGYDAIKAGQIVERAYLAYLKWHY